MLKPGIYLSTQPGLDKRFTRVMAPVKCNLMLKVGKPASMCKQEVETLGPPSNGYPY